MTILKIILLCYALQRYAIFYASAETPFIPFAGLMQSLVNESAISGGFAKLKFYNF